MSWNSRHRILLLLLVITALFKTEFALSALEIESIGACRLDLMNQEGLISVLQKDNEVLRVLTSRKLNAENLYQRNQLTIQNNDQLMQAMKNASREYFTDPKYVRLKKYNETFLLKQKELNDELSDYEARLSRAQDKIKKELLIPFLTIHERDYLKEQFKVTAFEVRKYFESGSHIDDLYQQYLHQRLDASLNLRARTDSSFSLADYSGLQAEARAKIQVIHGLLAWSWSIDLPGSLQSVKELQVLQAYWEAVDQSLETYLQLEHPSAGAMLALNQKLLTPLNALFWLASKVDRKSQVDYYQNALVQTKTFRKNFIEHLGHDLRLIEP